MDITPWLKSLEDSGVASTIRNSAYLFPSLEAAHVMALALMLGTITVVDLRLLGLASRARSAERVSSEVLTWTWAAFAVVALSGVTMFTTNARVYAHNTAFLIKLALLAAAGVNMLTFHLTAARSMDRWDRQAAPPIGKAAAALSLVLWVAVVFAGRIVGFTTTGMQAKEQAPPPSTTNFDDFLTGGASDALPAAPAPAPAKREPPIGS
ncbi:MAG TPA: DUF6644 family protein [Caulobacteraceae bacterium]|jgi:hypothetical protein